MRVRVLKSQVLGESSLEAFDRGTLGVVDDGFAEGNRVVETLEDRIAVACVSVLSGQQSNVSVSR